MDKRQILSIITYCNVDVFRFPGLIEKLPIKPRVSFSFFVHPQPTLRKI